MFKQITEHGKILTSTLEAKKTHVGAMSTGSMLFSEYLQHNRRSSHRGITHVEISPTQHVASTNCHDANKDHILMHLEPLLSAAH